MDNSAVTIPAIARALAIARQHSANPATVAETSRAPAAAVRILQRAATEAGSLADPNFGATLADMPGASRAFLQSLGGRSAFAAALDAGVLTRAPLDESIAAATSAMAVAANGEGQGIPVRDLDLADTRLESQRADALIVVTADVLRNSSAASQAFLARQLRRGLARALDVAFIDALIDASAVYSTASAGTTAANRKADVLGLLDAVNPGDGRLFWVAASDVANRLAVLDERAQTSPEGASEFCGAPLYVSSGMTAGTLLLADGDRIAADVASLGVGVTRHASVQMDDAPTMDSTTPTASTMVSLWQTNSVGLKLSALFGVQKGDEGAVGVVTGIAWSA